MFRDLKEYQNLQELYEKKVSKPENLVEKVNAPGSGVNVKPNVKVELEKKINVKPNTDLNAISKYMDNNRKEVTMSDFKSSTPENNNQKIDTSNEIESDANYAKTNARFNQRFNKDVKIVRNSQMSGKQRAQEMAKKRIAAKKAGTYEKPKTAQELAKERIAAKKAGTYEKPKTAQELAKERIAAKKRLANIKVEDYSPYDMVLEYLLSTEQAATIEEANYVMMQLDEENIQEIVGTVAKGLKAVGKFGAKSPLHFAALAGTTAALAPSVGKGLYKAKETVGNIANTITNFDPIGDARKKNIEAKQKKYREKSGTTKDDGYFYDPTIDKKR